MKHFKNNLLALIVIALISITINAQEKTKISIEIDPATYLFDGYSLHLRIQPKNYNHTLMGIGIYGMNLPDMFVNFDPKNKGKGWNVRINKGISLFGEYHFNEVNKKWFIGTQLGIQEFEIKNSSGKSNYNNILTMAYLGYTFKPFKNNFYLKPWTGFGYTAKINGKNTINRYTYNIAPITMFATLHMGYTF